jgi:NAD(P)-dependent dehydrogenase (short-subunit alcohol dehydrogenase family)
MRGWAVPPIGEPREQRSVADGSLRGQLVLVAGASRGIGAATASALAQAGARVVLAARDRDSIEALARAIAGAGGDAIALPADLSRPEDVSRLFEAVEEAGRLAALVYCAGVLTPALLEETSDEIWEDTLRVNLTGAFLCARAAFSIMRRHGEGRIVNVASLSGVYGTEKFPGLAAYNVSKYGVVGLTEAIAVEGKPFGVSAVCLSPGAVDTDMLKAANPDLRPGLVPAQVADVIVALLDRRLVAASGANIPLFSNA